MVKTVNVTLDDEVHERATEAKEELGLSWNEYIEEAADCLLQDKD